jgi:hypothetical protein
VSSSLGETQGESLRMRRLGDKLTEYCSHQNVRPNWLRIQMVDFEGKLDTVDPDLDGEKIEAQ